MVCIPTLYDTTGACPLQEGSLFWGTFDFESPDFEWGSDYQRPNLPPQDLIVYEMPVRSFTADPSSKVGDGNQGTFKGVAEKVCLSRCDALSMAHNTASTSLIPDLSGLLPDPVALQLLTTVQRMSVPRPAVFCSCACGLSFAAFSQVFHTQNSRTGCRIWVKCLYWTPSTRAAHLLLQAPKC